MALHDAADFRDGRYAELADIPLHDAEMLTGNGGIAHIRLHGQVYTLRITRQGKLILTK